MTTNGRLNRLRWKANACRIRWKLKRNGLTCLELGLRLRNERLLLLLLLLLGEIDHSVDCWLSLNEAFRSVIDAKTLDVRLYLTLLKVSTAWWNTDDTFDYLRRSSRFNDGAFLNAWRWRHGNFGDLFDHFTCRSLNVYAFNRVGFGRWQALSNLSHLALSLVR